MILRFHGLTGEEPKLDGGGGLGLCGAHPVQRGVSAAAVVKPFDVLKDRVRQLDAGGSTLAVGEARKRLPRAVERTVPFGLTCLSLVTVW
jgi:hypothetical protein